MRSGWLVRGKGSVSAFEDAFARAVAPDNLGWGASEGEARFGERLGNNGIGTNNCVIPDHDRPVELGSGPYVDVVADAWREFMRLRRVYEQRGTPNMSTHMDTAVFPDPSRGIDHQQPVMHYGDARPENIWPHTESHADGQATEPKQDWQGKQAGLARVDQIFVEPHQDSEPRHRIEDEASKIPVATAAAEICTEIILEARPVGYHVLAWPNRSCRLLVPLEREYLASGITMSNRSDTAEAPA